ncbi:MAG: pitrilysin family protein [Verrucomicrobiota bacterium]
MSQYHQEPSSDPLLRAIESETVNRTILENGLTVIHKEDHSAELVSVQTWVKTGSIHESDKIGAGLSHYLEHLLFKGTDKRGSLDITREIHASGGYINAYTTFDRTVYYIDAPANAAETCFDLLSDMVFHSTLPSAEITRERDVILREIDMGLDDPDRKQFHTFAQTAFREHPYRHPVIGHRTLFEGVTEDELRSYYAGRYAPNNVVLVVAGAIDSEACQQLAEKYFSAEPMRQLSPAWYPEEPTQLAPRSDRETGDYNVVRGMIGYKVPGLGHTDAPAMDVLARLLGSGSSSWLWQRIREEQRLVHQIDAGCWNPGSHGLLWITYLCDPGKREIVEKAIHDELTRVQNRLPLAEEVAKAVRQSVVAEVNTRKTISGQASRLGAAEVVAGDLGFPRQHLAQLGNLSAEAIQTVAQRYLVPQCETAVSIEPAVKAVNISTANHSSGLTDFEEVQFANGARLLLQPGGNLPKTHIRYVALGGPAWEASNQRGVSGVLASILTRDTQKRSYSEIANDIESVGGSFGEFVGNNTFGLSLETLSGDFSLAADLLGQALHHSKYLDEAFTIERDAQFASLQEDEDEVLEWSRRRLRSNFFGEHPYGIDYLGREEDLQAMTVEDARALGARLIAGPNTAIAVSGQFDRSQVVDTLGPIIDGLRAEFDPVTMTQPKPVGSQTLELHRDREQAVVLVAYPDVGIRQSEDHLVGEALDEIFSGMSSQLFQQVREERGMAYYVGSQRLTGLDCGMFNFYAGTSAAQAQDVLAEIFKEVERAKAGGLTTSEFNACRTRLVVRRQQSQQAPGSRAMQACLSALYGKDPNNWRDYPDRVRALTLDQLHAFARKHFDAANQLVQTTLPGKA